MDDTTPPVTKTYLVGLRVIAVRLGGDREGVETPASSIIDAAAAN
jgi:hypothetical protein